MFDGYGPPIVGTSSVLLMVALTAAVPCVRHRRAGRGRAAPSYGRTACGLVPYALAVTLIVVGPPPRVTDGFCDRYRAQTVPQLRPFLFVEEVAGDVDGRGLRSMIYSDDFWLASSNALLLVPLGALLRYSFRASLTAAAAVPFAASLFFEATQLTGTWWFYPCPYRLFDVDDVLLNTGGALLGYGATALIGLERGRRGVR